MSYSSHQNWYTGYYSVVLWYSWPMCYYSLSIQANRILCYVFFRLIILKIEDEMMMRWRFCESLENTYSSFASIWTNLMCIGSHVHVSRLDLSAIQRSWFHYFTAQLNACHWDGWPLEGKQKFALVVNFSVVLWSLLSQYLIRLYTQSEQMKKKYHFFQITFKVMISPQVKSTQGNQFNAEPETLSIIPHYLKALL